MSVRTSLENMGLSLSLTPDGKLAVEGLKRLDQEKREYALTLAKQHKDAIVGELEGHVEGIRVKIISQDGAILPDYEAFCPRYWRGCPSCPDYLAGKLRFCAGYNRLEAPEVRQ